jgi:hypothetical protein
MLGNTYVQFSVGGHRMRASLMRELNILQAERSWRCYAGLLEEGYARARADGAAFGYGFLLRSGLRLNQRLGSTCLGRVPVFAGFVNLPRALQGRGVPRALSAIGWLGQPLVRLRRGGSRSDRLEVRRLEGPFDRSFDGLWQVLEGTRPLAVVRDSAYLNWRYLDCRDRPYERLAAFRGDELVGLVVFRLCSERRTSYVVDLFARDDSPVVLDVLLEAALESLTQAGAGIVTASFLSPSAEAAALGRVGFQRWPTRVWNRWLCVVADPRGPAGAALRASNWYFSFGDWLSH